jgi:hypothetical protein
MDTLPNEILSLVLGWNVRMCRGDKNALIELRCVCKAFDIVLKPYIFKTVQLEFSRFLRHEKTPSIRALERVGHHCESIYLDMMIVRDEGTSTHSSTTRPQGGAPKTSLPEPGAHGMEYLRASFTIESSTRACLLLLTFHRGNRTTLQGLQEPDVEGSRDGPGSRVSSKILYE